MNSLSLLITSPPFDSQGQYSAYRFCLAAVEKKLTVNQVFFYQSAVLVANRLITPLSDELNIQDMWLQLANQHSIPLNVCITAANRRGIIDNEDARQQGLSSNLATGFNAVGLGELYSITNESDRLVQF
jgi:tRNA 2-thiouridine synthesizing protein D